MFLLCFGYNYFCYLAPHAWSQRDLFRNDFVTDDPTGRQPKKKKRKKKDASSLPEADCFVLHGSGHKSERLPNSYKKRILSYIPGGVVVIVKLRVVEFGKRRTALLLFASCPQRGGVRGAGVFMYQWEKCCMPTLHNVVWSFVSSAAAASVETACLPAGRSLDQIKSLIHEGGWMEESRDGKAEQRRGKNWMGEEWKGELKRPRCEWRRGQKMENSGRLKERRGLKWPHWQAVPRFQDRCASEPGECDISY